MSFPWWLWIAAPGVIGLGLAIGTYLVRGVDKLAVAVLDHLDEREDEARAELEAQEGLRRMAEGYVPLGSDLQRQSPNSKTWSENPKDWSWTRDGAFLGQVKPYVPEDCALAPDPDWLYNGAINGATEETSALPHVERDE